MDAHVIYLFIYLLSQVLATFRLDQKWTMYLMNLVFNLLDLPELNSINFILKFKLHEISKGHNNL
jgi:hypothetical protein